jgi:hypothetical protein
MIKNDFFVFSDKHTRGAVHATNRIHPLEFDHVKIIRGESTINTVIDYYQFMGTKMYDLVGSGYSGLYLLSHKITNLLYESNITGWKNYPVILHDKKGNIIDGYSLFAIIGRCGAIDWSKSEKFQKKFVPHAPFANMIRGAYFDIDTWDGSDIFLAEGTLHMFVTRKVRNLLVKNKITNVDLTNITQYETSDRSIPPDEKMIQEVNDLMRRFGFLK